MRNALIAISALALVAGCDPLDMSGLDFQSGTTNSRTFEGWPSVCHEKGLYYNRACGLFWLGTVHGGAENATDRRAIFMDAVSEADGAFQNPFSDPYLSGWCVGAGYSDHNDITGRCYNKEFIAR